MKRALVALDAYLLRVLMLVLAFAIASSLARISGRFFYCEAMGLQRSACDTSPPEQDVALLPAHAGCCEVVTVPGLPDASMSSAAVPVHAPVGVWQSAAPLVQPRFALVRSPRGGLGRGPPFASERRAELMIFLT